MDEGWTRWLFEQYEFDFANLRNVDFYRDSLDQFDVIVLPDETSESILEGFRLGTVPPRYKGGIGQPGVRNLEAFVRNGGTLVIVGLFGGQLPLSLALLPFRNLRIMGSFVGSLPDLRALVALVNERGVPPIPFETRPLSEATRSLEDLKAGRVMGRVVLRP